MHDSCPSCRRVRIRDTHAVTGAAWPDVDPPSDRCWGCWTPPCSICRNAEGSSPTLVFDEPKRLYPCVRPDYIPARRDALGVRIWLCTACDGQELPPTEGALQAVRSGARVSAGEANSARVQNLIGMRRRLLDLRRAYRHHPRDQSPTARIHHGRGFIEPPVHHRPRVSRASR